MSLQPDFPWDPGLSPGGDDSHEVKRVSPTFYMLLSAAVMDTSAMDEDEHDTTDTPSRTELDSHANMPVVGRHAYIISDTGKTASVSPYNPDYPTKVLKIVDAAVLYHDRFTGKDYILILRNALYVPSMVNNLVPPFIMREFGIIVNEVPKIHSRDPSLADHCILIEDELRIPLSLHGTFSYFLTRKPTVDELNGLDGIYLLTPEEFNPHCSTYGQNEENMLDWQGELKPPQHREGFVVDDLPDIPETVAAARALPDVEQQLIDACVLSEDMNPDPLAWSDIECCALSTVLCARTLCDRLEARREIAAMMASIGSCHASSAVNLLDSDDEDESPSEEEEFAEIADLSAEDLIARLSLAAEAGELDLDEIMVSATYAKPSKGVQAAHLSKIWKIDLKTAERTLERSTQLRRMSQDPKLARNYGTNDRMLRYRRINKYFFMDTFFATKNGGKSSRGNTCCQLFVSDTGFVYVVPMRKKSDVLSAVKQFAKEIGAPDAIVCDAAGEQTSIDLKRFMNSVGTTLRVLEQNTPWSNRAELYVGLMKEAVRRDMRSSKCPLVFWDYCLERRARINNLTAKDSFQLHGQTPHEDIHGSKGDISNICHFDFYEWCYSFEDKASFPVDKQYLGRCLGPATGTGNEMCQWVLLMNGEVVARRTVRPLTVEERHSPTEEVKRRLYDATIYGKYGHPVAGLKKSKKKKTNTSDATEDVVDMESEPSSEEEKWEQYVDSEEMAKQVPDMDDAVDIHGRLLNQQPMFDRYLNLEIYDANGKGKVVQRVTNQDGRALGTYDDHPAMNTMMYEIEYDDGSVREYGATAIAENILAQVDEDGFSSPLLKAIVDFRKDDKAIRKENAEVTDPNTGRKRPRKTTQGWDLLVLWSDGNQSWIPLKFLKESNPVDVADFAVARGIADEPAFSWWVPYTLRKRDIIISAVKARARRVTHKYGIELPRSVAHAMELDEKNGNKFWTNALAKEMYEIGVAVEVLGEGVLAPPGWSRVHGHIVWDVKMDFTRKARWVLEGHKTPDPLCSQYAGVVSRESVRIAFTYAALNELQVAAADIRNAYLQAPSSRKDYIVCGPEFGIENAGRVALIHRALYGGKTAGRDFRNHLRACMRHLEFISCPADPDVWMRPAEKPDGSHYWEYILLYTDDCLCVSMHPEQTLRTQIGKYFQLKEESIGPPQIYLGGKVREVTLDTGVRCWAFGSSQYVRQAVTNVEKYLSDCASSGDARFKLPPRANTPMRTEYRPELDTSNELNPKDAAYFQSLIGVLRWIVELGRVDVCLEVSVMSSMLALPRHGHLEQVLHIFSYLKKYHNAELVFDPSYPVINEAAFERKDWSTSEFGHLDLKEELPPSAPQSRGKGFIIRAYVDADHATDTVTRRSRTGFIVYCNCALVNWLSKKQTSVESSSFGSEFCAMKLCCEYLRGLRYKLRMMGIPVLGPAYILGDNQSVLSNTSIPESQLKKKSQSIAYHFIREGVARDEWRTAYVNTHLNVADLLTKLLPFGEKRRGFVRQLVYHVYGDEPT